MAIHCWGGPLTTRRTSVKHSWQCTRGGKGRRRGAPARASTTAMGGPLEVMCQRRATRRARASRA
eukprot:8764379-Alexandrium_andersonii.AAC.1